MSVAFPTRKPVERDAMRDWIRAKMREGMDSRDIASQLGVKEAEVWNRLARTDHLPKPGDAA